MRYYCGVGTKSFASDVLDWCMVEMPVVLSAVNPSPKYSRPSHHEFAEAISKTQAGA